MLFGLTAFLGAFLLFLMQPFMGRVLTPILGGGAGVWITCLVFFQAALVGGYALAHGIATLVSPRRQARGYGALAGLVALALGGTAIRAGSPLLVAASPAGLANYPPALQAVLLLALSAGPLFVLLAATAPLVQAWHTSIRPDASPYRLYALSNAGSLAGLLAYPFLLEPQVPLRVQAWSISILFLVVAGLMFGLVRKFRSALESAPARKAKGPGSVGLPAVLRWGLLAATGSMLLVALTQVLAWNLASTPLVWVLPLLAFLLTFIIAFRWQVPESVLLGLLLIFLALALITPIGARPGHTLALLAWGLGLMLSGGLLVHVRLARLQPPAEYLTAYYLIMAAGGALGGAAAALLPPLLFHRFYELPIALAAVGLAAWVSALGMERINRSVVLLAASLSIATAAGLGWAEARKPGYWTRDFYGAHAVLEVRGKLLLMVDGQVNHGMELLQAPRRPISYYGPDSAVGRSLGLLRTRTANLRIGVVGLGGGGMAANAAQGDELVFFEISPEIIRLSGFKGTRFTFLANCPARVSIIEGDGRARLREDGTTYDLLMLDAFSGGNVPTHLLTREALMMYMAHLKPGGLLVFNTSNPLPIHLPLLANVRDLGFSALEIHERARWEPGFPVPLEMENHQLVVAREMPSLLNPELLAPAWILVGPGGAAPSPGARTAWEAGTAALRDAKPWTDGRSSLGDVMFKHR